MSHLPFVSVVVPVLNCADEVAPFVRTLRKQTYPTDQYEIIIVDNGSTDGTFEAIQRTGVTALQRKERGRSRALNTGILHASGDIICTTDISCFADPNWIQIVVESFKDPEVACVAGEIKLLKTHDNAAVRFQDDGNYMSPMLALNRRELPYMPYGDGANSSFRRALFSEIGLFEESFIKAADVEICYRIHILTGYKILFNHNAILWEPCENNLYALLKQRFRIGIGYNLLKIKFPQLYEYRQRNHSLRETYWSLRNETINILKLIWDNGNALFRQDQNNAVFNNIRFLMRLAQGSGKLYGKWHLKKIESIPDPIDPEKLDEFLLNYDSLRDRIIVVPLDSKTTLNMPSEI